jgi:hypothetical protein
MQRDVSGFTEFNATNGAVKSYAPKKPMLYSMSQSNPELTVNTLPGTFSSVVDYCTRISQRLTTYIIMNL